jgi:predicted amidophosphoribosyltransferase
MYWQDICDNCGRELPNDTGTYCPHCGEPRYRYYAAYCAPDWKLAAQRRRRH